MLKLLAELGRRAPVLAAASISAPIDLKATQRNMARWRNALYHRRLLRWLAAEQRPTDLVAVTTADIKAYLASMVTGLAAPSSTARAFRSLQQLYRWLDDEDEIGLHALSLRTRFPPFSGPFGAPQSR